MTVIKEELQLQLPAVPSPRPLRYGSDAIAWGVATLLCADLGWKDYEDSEADGYDGSEKEALVQTLQIELSWDGYALARALDDTYGIEMTANDVNQLDAAYIYQSRVHQELVKKWVTSNNLTPKYSVEQRVRVKNRQGETEEGVVQKVDPSTLTYTIYVETHNDSHKMGKYLGTIYDEEQILDVVS